MVPQLKFRWGGYFYWWRWADAPACTGRSLSHSSGIKTDVFQQMQIQILVSNIFQTVMLWFYQKKHNTKLVYMVSLILNIWLNLSCVQPIFFQHQLWCLHTWFHPLNFREYKPYTYINYRISPATHKASQDHCFTPTEFRGARTTSIVLALRSKRPVVMRVFCEAVEMGGIEPPCKKKSE